MNHMQLCRLYFEEYGRPMIEMKFPQIADRYAAGLVGEGSGCFGYDDEISTDHDFGPGFCIWLTDEDFAAVGAELQEAYDSLPDEFMGFSRSNIAAKDRFGVMTVGGFYESFTGCPAVPESDMDWFLISETNLATVTNGQVFVDKLGEFTRIRKGLLEFYPNDVLLKKLAARCAVISQSGQYNFPRCQKRGDVVAANLALAKFAESAMSMAHLLCKKPTPFYKWQHRSLKELEINLPIEDLFASPSEKLIEQICETLAQSLVSQGYADYRGGFLQDYIAPLMNRIKDPELRAMHPMADCL